MLCYQFHIPEFSSVCAGGIRPRKRLNLSAGLETSDALLSSHCKNLITSHLWFLVLPARQCRARRRSNQSSHHIALALGR